MISPIFDLVIHDFKERDDEMQFKHGKKMYRGSYGDKTLLEAYHEAMDLCVYLKAELERRA